MFRSVGLVVLILVVCGISCSDQQDENDVFVATSEWQVVKKGQKIPKGLHVRINFQTGVTEAKLNEEDDDTSKRAVLAIPQKTLENEAATPQPIIQLKEAMKNIKGDDILKPDEIKQIKDQFRSYEDIKKSFGELNLIPKIDAEVISDLLKKHKEIMAEEKVDKAAILRVIEDLDFLAHQYDNAIEFVNQNGFNEIIYNNLNSSFVEIKKDTLKLLGSLVQNNNIPKIRALETGAVGVLLRMINFDLDSGVKSRALTALSSILRSFPVAQQKFVESGGFTVIAKFFDTDDVKLQIKSVTMISDLVIERSFAQLDDSLNKYYTDFDLSTHVLEHDWCENLNKLLFRLLMVDGDDHDSIEKCLTAMHSLRSQCGDKYEKKLLVKLQKRYGVLAADDRNGQSEDFSNSVYFHVLKDICDQILYHVKDNVLKTEL